MSVLGLIETAEKGLGAFNDTVLTGFKWLAIFLLALMLLIVDIAVFMRYVMNDALAWSEEIAKFVMVWMTFIAAPLGLKIHAHVGIDALIGRSSGRVQQFLLFLIFAGIISLMVVFVKEGAYMTWNARIQRASTIDISILYVYICMPLGSLLVATVSLEYVLNAIKGMIDPRLARCLHPQDVSLNR